MREGRERIRQVFAPDNEGGGGAASSDAELTPEQRARQRRDTLDRREQQDVAHALNAFVATDDPVETGRAAIAASRALSVNAGTVFLDILIERGTILPQHVGRAAVVEEPHSDEMAEILAAQGVEAPLETKDDFTRAGLEAWRAGDMDRLQALVTDAQTRLNREDYYQFAHALEEVGLEFESRLINPANDEFLPLTYRQIADRLGHPVRVGKRARYWRLPTGDAMLFWSASPDNMGDLVVMNERVHVGPVPYRLEENGLNELREPPIEREVREYGEVKKDFWHFYKRENWPLHRALWGGFDHLATVAERKQLCQDVIDVEGPGSSPVIMNIFDRYEHALDLGGNTKERITLKQASKRFESARIGGLADLKKLYEESKERLATKDVVALRKWMQEQDWLDHDMVKEVLDADTDFKSKDAEKKSATPERAKGRSLEEIRSSIQRTQNEIDEIYQS